MNAFLKVLEVSRRAKALKADVDRVGVAEALSRLPHPSAPPGARAREPKVVARTLGSAEAVSKVLELWTEADEKSTGTVAS